MISECLALALYFEARGEGSRGLEAVAETLMNRGGDICLVIEDACEPYWQKVPFDIRGAEKVREIIVKLEEGHKTNLTNGAKFFSRGLPSWAIKPVHIGHHYFYQEKPRVN